MKRKQCNEKSSKATLVSGECHHIGVVELLIKTEMIPVSEECYDDDRREAKGQTNPGAQLSIVF